MNCSMCMYVDSNVVGGTFMYGGSSYCKRHLVLAMQPATSKSDKKASLKWSEGKQGD